MDLYECWYYDRLNDAVIHGQFIGWQWQRAVAGTGSSKHEIPKRESIYVIVEVLRGQAIEIATESLVHQFYLL